jgi:hypothetical protein
MFRLSLFRRLARPIALLVLLAGAVSLLHSGIDDPACASLEGSEEGTARLGGAPADSSDHCLVCHWARTLRAPSPSIARALTSLVATTRVDVPQPALQHPPSIDRCPARAPPRSL